MHSGMFARHRQVLYSRLPALPPSALQWSHVDLFFLRGRLSQRLPHYGVNRMTRAIHGCVQASLEHGSVSLVLLAGGVGKRMGVRLLILACTCARLSNAIGFGKNAC